MAKRKVFKKINPEGLKPSTRLRILAGFLDEVPRKAFDMSTWGQGKEPPTLERMAEPEVCGTSACALGLAATVFAGLEFESRRDGRFYNVVHSESRERGHGAGADVLGITDTEAELLFYPSEYGRDSNCGDEDCTYCSNGRPDWVQPSDGDEDRDNDYNVKPEAVAARLRRLADVYEEKGQ